MNQRAEEIRMIADLMARSNDTVVVTGAGISTEAGIPDFRGPEGIYRKLGEDSVMEIINIEAFRRDPEGFYAFFREHFIGEPVQPGLAHQILAKMEQDGLIRGVVTQNIDGLHQAAGSRNVIAIHGSADRFICTGRKCRQTYPAELLRQSSEPVPRCQVCGSVLKPDVVLFGEAIQNFFEAREMVLAARLLIVIGSSLTVYPLAGFVEEFSTLTQDLLIINKGYTKLDHAARIKLEPEHTGKALESVYHRLQKAGSL
ncbi:MAG: SIR2 family NAD-dependent protein deacylase [Solirubrobacterales bacterium]